MRFYILRLPFMLRSNVHSVKTETQDGEGGRLPHLAKCVLLEELGILGMTLRENLTKLKYCGTPGCRIFFLALICKN